MKILWLGPVRDHIFQTLKQTGCVIEPREDPMTLSQVQTLGAEFIVSYGYRHRVSGDVLRKYPLKAINLHISYLPWNRGAHPNLWSFLENSPKGVTIHYMDEQFDTGQIIVQQQVDMTADDTLRTSYDRLSDTIESLFLDWWSKIAKDDVKPIPQIGKGSLHKTADSAPFERFLTKGWDTPVRDLIGKALIPRTGVTSHG